MAAAAVTKENYLLHKLHSLSGIIPVGYYLVQHLALNSFSLASPEAFNGVVHFFEGIPKHVLIVLKYGLIWLPLIFHAVYGLFIVARATPNYSNAAYKFRENRMYSLQRWSGVVAFLFLCYHMATTSLAASIAGSTVGIEYAAWQAKLSANGYILFLVYVIGVVASTYHFSYGIWNFCIRWGITISEKAQMSLLRVSAGLFVLLTLLGIGALSGFLIHDPTKSKKEVETVQISAPLTSSSNPNT